MKIAIITGASSGLGLEFAKQIDKSVEGIDELWLIARRKERLVKLAESLQHPVKIIPLNLMEDSDIDELDALLHKEKPCIRYLINSAGFGMLGPFAQGNIKEQLDMIQLNCSVLTKITYLALPFMKEQSRIIQIASSAAFLPQRNFAVYAASKSYVHSFSYALNSELEERKIHVTSVCPGPVATEFFDIAEKNGSIMKVKKLIMVKPEKVIKKALHDSARKRVKSVYSLPIKGIEIISRLIPHRYLLLIMKYVK